MVNKAHTPAKIKFPMTYGKARIVTHQNLKNPYSDPLNTSFDIGKNKLLIHLKEG